MPRPTFSEASKVIGDFLFGMTLVDARSFRRPGRVSLIFAFSAEDGRGSSFRNIKLGLDGGGGGSYLRGRFASEDGWDWCWYLSDLKDTRLVLRSARCCPVLEQTVRGLYQHKNILSSSAGKCIGNVLPVRTNFSCIRPSTFRIFLRYRDAKHKWKKHGSLNSRWWTFLKVDSVRRLGSI